MTPKDVMNTKSTIQMRLADIAEKYPSTAHPKVLECMLELCKEVEIEGKRKVVDYVFRHMEFDSIAHAQGKCSFSTVSICSAEEHRIKNILYDALKNT